MVRSEGRLPWLAFVSAVIALVFFAIATASARRLSPIRRSARARKAWSMRTSSRHRAGHFSACSMLMPCSSAFGSATAKSAASWGASVLLSRSESRIRRNWLAASDIR
jgi:CBS domain containing-hemolysin-like protein